MLQAKGRRVVFPPKSVYFVQAGFSAGMGSALIDNMTAATFEHPGVSQAPIVPGGAISPSTLRWLALGLVLLGVGWRLLRYFLQFPLWGDEAFVCVNFLKDNFVALTGPLDCDQVAPLFFLWGELAIFKLLGGSELAVRLLPLLAGLASLALFWRLAWRLLPPLGAAL